FVDHSLALAADAYLAAVAEDLVADARLRATLGTDQLDVARVQRRLALHDAALHLLAGVRLRVALDHVHAFDDEAILADAALGARQHLEHAPALAAVLAGDDEHVVVLPNRRS